MGRQVKCAEHSEHLCKLCTPSWAINTLLRYNGLVEDVCKHGVGHPNKTLTDPKNYYGVHGCCGCCFRSKNE